MARIMVAGGGVGGLFAARLLGAGGHSVTLVERAPAPPQIGAGLVLPASTADLLSGAGVDVRGIVLPLESLSVTGPTGRRRAGARGRVSVARPDLVRALLDGVDDCAEIRCSTELTSVETTADGVRCRTGPDEVVVDVLVGADGIRSTTRTHLAPQVPLRSAGQVCWRGVLDHGSWDDHAAGQRPGAHATELWTGAERVGLVPLLDGRTYAYLVRRDDEVPAHPTSSGATDRLPAREAAAVRALLALPQEVLLRHELWELDRPVWVGVRTALVGDAAHAISPNLGLGAALALADAAVLARALSRSRGGGRTDVAAALHRYRTARATPVRAVQLASRAVGALAHSRRPAAVSARRALGVQAGQ